MRVSAAATALPWGRMSGGAYARPDRGVATQRVKLYSAQWLMMAGWWAETLLTWNRGSALTPELATRAIMSLFGIEFEEAPATPEPAMLTMPGPGESHNLTPESYTHRIENQLILRDNQAPILPLLHAYRTAEDLARLLERVRPFAGPGLWIHRYGYLSDEKLEILRQEWSRS
jgi:hypothetical protein